MYVYINPRDVPAALKETHSRYYKWLESKAGMTKQQVRKGGNYDFAGTLNRVLDYQVSHHKSRGIFSVIDVDDNDPTTWLERIRQAIGEVAMEMIIETKNGFHVVYHSKKMGQESHMALAQVLQSDTGTGQDAKVTKLDGCALNCALPGGCQGTHRARILYCSCSRKKERGNDETQVVQSEG
jgi:hypothetical protein